MGMVGILLLCWGLDKRALRLRIEVSGFPSPAKGHTVPAAAAHEVKKRSVPERCQDSAAFVWTAAFVRPQPCRLPPLLRRNAGLVCRLLHPLSTRALGMLLVQRSTGLRLYY